MPARRPNRAALTLVAEGERADAARRELLADWCRLVGDRVARGPRNRTRPAASPPAPGTIASLGLPPRLAQTLAGLLAGGSEKQIALSLSISPHTVHTYVKQLHKRFGVASRGELLARFIGRP